MFTASVKEIEIHPCQFFYGNAFHAAKAHKEGLTWFGAGHGYFPTQLSEN